MEQQEQKLIFLNSKKELFEKVNRKQRNIRVPFGNSEKEL